MERQKQHRGKFRSDDARQAFIDAVLRRFTDPDGPIHIRLHGAAGVGKTRLALEAFRDPDEGALYASEPPPDHSFFHWMAVNPEVRATLLVDECDPATALKLEQASNMSERRLRLLTIGTVAPEFATGDGRDGVFLLDNLDEEAVFQLLLETVPELAPNQATWIARSSHGYLRLAKSLARQVALGHLTVAEIASTSEIEEVLTSLIPDETTREALAALSLLARVGVQGDLQGEARALAHFMGISWHTMRSGIRRGQASGLVARQGRYRYVTPELLAIWLASNVWAERGTDILGLIDSLPNPDSRDALVERLGSLGGVSEVESVLKSMLSAKGPFRALSDLTSPRSARLFGELTRANPRAGLRGLQRLIPSNPDELRGFTEGRREIIWTLERLAWREDTFFGAARLLRQLAAAENEPYANNATGVWSGLFLTHLAGTSVPAVDRYPLIEEALDSDNARDRSLAIAALDAALTVQEIGLGIGDDTGGFVPSRRWQPSNWTEDHISRRAALDLVDRALSLDEETVWAAKAALISNSRGLASIGLADDVMDRLANLPLAGVEDRFRVWEALKSILDYEANALTEEQRARASALAEEIFGGSFADRLRRYVGQQSHVDWRDRRSEPQAQERWLNELAREAMMDSGKFVDALPWLFSGKAEGASAFGRSIANVDPEGEWLEALLNQARGSDDPRLLSGYLIERAQQLNNDWREDLLDEWSRDPTLAFVVLDATWRSEPGGRGLGRLLKLIDSELLPVGSLQVLRFGKWPSALSGTELGDVADRLVATGAAANIEVALSLILSWLDGRSRSEITSASQSIWNALESSPSDTSTQMHDYYWNEIAGHLLQDSPTRVAGAVLNSVARGSAGTHDERLVSLKSALAAAPEEVWDLIGTAMLQEQKVRWTLSFWSTFEANLVEDVDPEILLRWTEEHGVKAAEAVASLVKPQDEISPLVRQLIRRHGWDSSVAHILTSNFDSGSWTGSQSSREEKQLSIVSKWLNDPEPEVRSWAQAIHDYIEARLPELRLLEEEEFPSRG